MRTLQKLIEKIREIDSDGMNMARLRNLPDAHFMCTDHMDRKEMEDLTELAETLSNIFELLSESSTEKIRGKVYRDHNSGTLMVGGAFVDAIIEGVYGGCEVEITIREIEED